jgi:hypothetical protein
MARRIAGLSDATVRRSLALLVTVFAALLVLRIVPDAAGRAGTLEASAAPAPQETEKDESESPRGLVRREPGAAPGYTLLSPLSSEFTYLVDLDGQVVHQWESLYRPGLAPYLLPNGDLLRGIQVDAPVRFRAGGRSGGFQEFGWDGRLIWEFQLASDRYFHHHDVEPLPNGNFLAIAWEWRTKEEVLEAGRVPDYVGEGGLWSCIVVEIEPIRPYGARVVWEWKAWDHLIQDTDPSLPNYGVVQDHPERIDINGDIRHELEAESEEDADAALADADGDTDSDTDDGEGGRRDGDGMTDQERARLIALGYLTPDPPKADRPGGGDRERKRERKRNRGRDGSGDGNGTADDDGSPDGDGDANADDDGDGRRNRDRDRRNRERADWLHLNGIDYNAELDQIVLSSWHMNEIWIIDHGTTTEEAAGRTGGRAGRGC